MKWLRRFWGSAAADVALFLLVCAALIVAFLVSLWLTPWVTS